MAKKKSRKSNGSVSNPFDWAAGNGMHQALLGWNTEFFHDLIENDPELRRFIHKNTLAMFERLVQIMRERLERESNRP